MVRNHYVVHVQPALEPVVCGVLERYGVAVRVADAASLCERVVSGRAVGVVAQLERIKPEQVCTALLRLRDRHPLLPLLALVDPLMTPAWFTLSARDVECLPLPIAQPSLHRYAQRALAFGALPDEAVAHWVSHLARERALTTREVQLLVMALQHLPRSQMRRVLGVSENTLKTQVRGLLRKCGERSLDALAKNTLRVALLEARPGGRDLYRAPWMPSPVHGVSTSA